MDTDVRLIELYLEKMAVENGSSVHTLAAYRRDLIQASRWLNGNLSGATGEEIGQLSQQMRELARSSVARKSSAIRGFLNFLVDESVREDSGTAALPRPGATRGLPRVLSLQEVELLFAAIAERLSAERPSDLDLRLSALIELLYGSGLRASELVSLPRVAVRDERPFLILTGKGGRERLVPISDRARRAVMLWRAHVPENSLFLFPSRTGHISRIRLFQLVRQLAATAGLDPAKVSPHVLRHAFATHLLAGGAGLRALQTMLGHADIATTEIYTHVDASHLVELVNRRHPLAHADLQKRNLPR